MDLSACDTAVVSRGELLLSELLGNKGIGKHLYHPL